jgi:hypothetical protein
MDKENLMCVYSWVLLSHYKERNTICSEMDEIGDHHVR